MEVSGQPQAPFALPRGRISQYPLTGMLGATTVGLEVLEQEKVTQVGFRTPHRPTCSLITIITFVLWLVRRIHSLLIIKINWRRYVSHFVHCTNIMCTGIAVILKLNNGPKQVKPIRWPCGLKRWSAAAPLLRSRVRIPLKAWMFVLHLCRVV